MFYSTGPCSLVSKLENVPTDKRSSLLSTLTLVKKKKSFIRLKLGREKMEILHFIENFFGLQASNIKSSEQYKNWNK